MDNAAEKKLIEQIHHSGFPFQIGVRKEIERTANQHGWRISAEEHHWTHRASGKTGFIDLIAQHNQYVYSLVIECKRVRPKGNQSLQGPSWIFLTPSGNASNQSRLSGFKSEKIREEVGNGVTRLDKYEWQDVVAFHPQTMESAYCVFETQDEKSPMIERIADSLLPSVEAVAEEWLHHKSVPNHSMMVFLPVIVTNATLYTCTFDAADIGMTDGNLPNGKFEAVPFVRFRKGLVQMSGWTPNNDFEDTNRRQQRSLLIVNAASMADTLKQIIIGSL